MTESWYPDELPYAGAEHLDPAFVAGYDHKQGRPDAAPAIAAFRAHGLDGTSTVLDLAAGTGQFALAAASQFGRVIAVDISPVMVAALRAGASRSELSNLDIVEAGFLRFEHQGPPVDGVHTRHGLHQLPDFWKAIALDRIVRLLRPGGVLWLRDLIYDFTPAEAPAAFERWFTGAAADPVHGYTAADYREHIQTEHSTFRWLFEPMLTATGFEIVDCQYEGGLFGTYTCVRT